MNSSDTTALKNFATRARTDLLREVEARMTFVLAEGSSARTEQVSAVNALERAVAEHGVETIVDRVAYTWFNRLVALRFMDANGYTGVGVVSPEAAMAGGQPQVLADAKGGHFDADVVPVKMQDDIAALLNGTRPSSDAQGEAYGLLLEAYCRFWNRSMPFMFEREGDYTELLIPTGLLAAESVRGRAVSVMTDEVCCEVEVIGWLYQFYISERKDEVFAGFKKNKKAGAAEIPAATQLFTPHWIVRYLVENSVGRLWLLNHPESNLAAQMEYYIAPVDEETDFLKISSPEELTIIDPAAGSGHMLTYAFDLLYAIYEEESYTPSEIPAKILEHNLFGAEIDPRAGALAAFALTMKAAAKRKLFLKDPVQPNATVLQNVRFEQDDLDYLWSLTRNTGVARADADAFWNAFEHADSIGSLIRPSAALVSTLEPIADTLEAAGGLLIGPVRRVLAQSRQLAQRYAVVVANPPYMSSQNFSADLAAFANSNYPNSKSDLFACFIERGLSLGRPAAITGMVTMQSWMFLATFQGLRRTILTNHSVVGVTHLGTGAFESIGGEVVSTVAAIMQNDSPGRRARIARLVDASPAAAKDLQLREMAQRPTDERWYNSRLADFLSVPRSPLAYWFSAEVIELFASRRTVASIAETAKGLVTANNVAFVRQWWEVSNDRIAFGSPTREDARATGARWFPYARGGSYRKWFGNIDAVVDWYDDGHAIQTTLTPDGSRVRATNTNLTRIFKPGVAWSSITTGRPAFRLVEGGHLYDAAGGICQSNSDLYVMGLLNSRAAQEILYGLNPTINVLPDYVGAVPVPASGPTSDIDDIVEECVAIQRNEWASRETAWEFVGGLTPSGPLGGAASTVLDARRARYSDGQQRLAEREIQIDDYFDRAFEVDSLGGAPAINQWTTDRYDIEGSARDLVSYAVGNVFGRYSLDEPGLILADQGSTLQDYLAKVPNPTLTPDADNVIPILDGEWFEDDIVGRFRKFLRASFGEEHFDENLRFVVESLGVKDLRDYFVKSFYKDHVRRYKKRPIYWLFSSPKGSFTALVYLHRYTPSTVSTVLNEYLREFIKKLEVAMEQQAFIAASGAGAREVAAAQKEADRIQKVLIELRDYERDLHVLASQQIALDLDEGVLVNYQKLGSVLRDIGLKRGSSDE